VPFDAVSVVEGYAALMTTAASWPEVVVTPNCAGVLLPPLFVVHPATKSREIRAEIPRRRDTRPEQNRKLLNIAIILFGQKGTQCWKLKWS
jgi:hypothetical protein